MFFDSDDSFLLLLYQQLTMATKQHTVLITGGTAGIGLALAQLMIKHGHQVLVTGRNPERLKLALQSCQGLDGMVSDVTNPEDRKNLRQWIEEQYAGLNILVNNAATGHGCLFADPSAADQVEREIQTNLVAPMHLTHELLPLLRSNRPATIVNVTSGYGLQPCPAVPGYTASKAGLSFLTQALHEQLRNEDILVMEACPPMVETAMTQGTHCWKLTPEQTAKAILRGIKKRKRRVLIGLCKPLEIGRRLFPDLTRWVLNRYPVSLQDLRDQNQV